MSGFAEVIGILNWVIMVAFFYQPPAINAKAGKGYKGVFKILVTIYQMGQGVNLMI